MKWTTPILLMLLCLNLIAIPLANATVDYNANTYTFTFLYTSYRTSMGFNTDMTFTRANRTDNFWYFTTAIMTEAYGFKLEQSSGTGASLLVTDYFVSSIDQLKFSVTANSGITTTTSIWVPTRGSPLTVSGASSWNYNPTTRILAVIVVHTSTIAITVTWGGDTTPPTYSNIGYNTTTIEQSCKFSCKWQDNIMLSGYYFSTNNTGVWANETFTTLSSNPAWANVTKTLNSTVGQVVGFKWYCNDTSNNWATSTLGTLTLTTTGSGYPSASNVQVSTTEVGELCLFTVTWTDDNGLANAIFSYDGTGSWVNDTAQALVGLVDQALANKTLPSTPGTTVHYRWYAEDIDDQWSSTSIYPLTTTLAPQFESTGPNVFEVETLVYTAENFNIDLNTTESLAFQNDLDLMLTVQVSAGHLNSTTNNVLLTTMGGTWGFTPIGDVNLKFYWKNGTGEVLSYVLQFVKVNDAVIANNTIVHFVGGTNNIVEWGLDLLISTGPILPLSFILGMVGLVSMIGGGMWTVSLLKNREFDKAISVAFIIAVIGFALFMTWLRA